MRLLFSNLSDFYSSLNSFLVALNQFVEIQRYEVVKKRIKKSVKKILKEAMLRCDKEQNLKIQAFKRRVTSIKSS
jgi:hypothetical protein